MSTYRTMVVDGSYLARSSYECGDLAQGVISRISSHEKALDPEIIVVAWDSQPYIRAEWDDTYKATRRKKYAEWDRRKEYESALRDVQDGLSYLGIWQARAAGWEADDVIATIARTWPGTTVIVSVDHDHRQLLSNRCCIATSPEEMLTHECPVDQGDRLTALMSLTGDSGDGVAGIPGIGPKKAKQILHMCPTFIDSLLSGNREPIQDALTAALVANRQADYKLLNKAADHTDTVRMTHKLISLYTIDIDLDTGSRDEDAAIRWLQAHDCEYQGRRLM